MIRVDVDGEPVPQGSMSAMPWSRDCPKCDEKAKEMRDAGRSEAEIAAFRAVVLGGLCGRRRQCVAGRELGANVIHSNDKEIKRWREEIATEIRLAMGNAAAPAYPSGPLILGVIVRLQRPQGHYKAGGGLSAEGLRNPEPSHKPDADKLLRAVLDAAGVQKEDTSGKIYADDAQATRLIVAKDWGKYGATILVPRPGTYCSLVEMATAVEALLPPRPRTLF